jgi:dCTP deaminase
MLKNDRLIRNLAVAHDMIEPFEPRQVKTDIHGRSIISYGTSSYGYDVRCAKEFKVFTGGKKSIVDPKESNAELFMETLHTDSSGEFCIIPPNSFALGRTLEYLRIPRDVLVLCVGKSTYARVGLIVNVTPLEPEWEGHVTLEFSNTTPSPVKVYANEGIAQLVFISASEVCETSYADRKGKYQGQMGITHGIV